MNNDTTRDLIQRLTDALEDIEDQHSALLDESRAFLDQPEPEGLTDEEILKIYGQFDINGTENVTKGMSLDVFWDSYQPQQLIASARAIIATDRARCVRSGTTQENSND